MRAAEEHHFLAALRSSTTTACFCFFRAGSSCSSATVSFARDGSRLLLLLGPPPPSSIATACAPRRASTSVRVQSLHVSAHGEPRSHSCTAVRARLLPTFARLSSASVSFSRSSLLPRLSLSLFSALPSSSAFPHVVLGPVDCLQRRAGEPLGPVVRSRRGGRQLQRRVAQEARTGPWSSRTHAARVRRCVCASPRFVVHRPAAELPSRRRRRLAPVLAQGASPRACRS